MQAFSLLIVSALAVLGLVGCSQTPMTHGQALSLERALDLGNDFTMANTGSLGGQLYAQACASCHEQGLNRAPHRSMLLLMSPRSIHRAMTVGVMQAQAAQLSGGDKVAPALAGGAIMVGSHSGTVYAFDRKTGCAGWTFDASAEVRTGVVVSPWTAGDTSAQPLAYFGDLIGNLYAVDAITGKVKWRARPDEHPNTTLTATPTLHNDVVYLPVSSLEVVPALEPDYECCKFRGSVVAYDAQTGKQLWQTYTVIEEPIPQGRNAAGTQNYGPSGAPIWNTAAINGKRNQLTVGTGENYSSPADGGSDAIFAIDLDFGAGALLTQDNAGAGDCW